MKLNHLLGRELVKLKMKSLDFIISSWWLLVICMYCDALSNAKHDGKGHTQYFEVGDMEAEEASTFEVLRQKRSAQLDVAGQPVPTKDDNITTVVRNLKGSVGMVS